MKPLLVLLTALLLAGCAAVPRPDRMAAGAPTAPPYDAWARVLMRHVDDRGRVDFDGVARSRSDLDRFVAYVYDFGPGNAPELFPTRDHVLAFHLNAYNALAMHNVIESGIPATLEGWRKVSFFLLRRVRVGGEAMSLYEYENRVIRALGDARIHVALNCMVVSCPRLPREPFLAATLQSQLESEARNFFSEPRNVRVDARARIVRLSEILKFYTADFLAAAPSLTAYVNRYAADKVPDSFEVEFLDYDWTINRQP
ncbi:MAG: DUF547 domain-containing protein [Usitatibacter sp.]